ncbi:DNA helicase B isoform X1 [Acipenser oxyrinchus oxyrinchus]|uniref:DNA helicase B isoform X1 n=1 Tax=Acipenser oxyrinchus oxyrinchus TaxID=40147 RepID=A0AAD8DCU6_ACIOX|nr:DNA helicase B isoform X1 [Acipenser oxyrinchus oxyrinchus]
MTGRRAGTRGNRTLVGYILPKKQVLRDEGAESLSEPEEEDNNEPEFLDFKEMVRVSSGGQLIKSSIPPRREVDFQDLKSEWKYKLVGRFSLSDPWWEVTASVQGGGGRSKLFLQGFPSYSLRTDLGDNPKSVIALFLKECGVVAEHVMQFMDWVPALSRLDFSNLHNLLKEFADEEYDHSDTVASDIISRISLSDAGKAVLVASRYPPVMRYVPTLLPRQFENLLKKYEGVQSDGRGEDGTGTSVLDKLEEVLRTDVWKLGFSTMTFRDLGLVRCEATLEAFRQCDLLPKIPELQRHALLLYDELKRSSREWGHTYITVENLTRALRHIPIEKAWESLKFLKDQKVVVQERNRVFLRHLYQYEKEIAECVEKLARMPPWCIDLDVKQVLRDAQIKRMAVKAHRNGNESECDDLTEDGAENADSVQLEHSAVNGLGTDPKDQCEDSDCSVELDPDQVKAAEMMCANPVTVISGKGGCGKTTVVSLIFQAAARSLRRQEEEEVQRACKDFENDLSASEDWDTFTQNPSQPQEQSAQDSGPKMPLEVLLTAPTGRAASLLQKRTGFEAYTLHQVLWSYMNVEKNEEGNPLNWKFNAVQIFVVDEGSLVSVQILYSVLSMLMKHAQLRKLVILGDVRQLPSIEPGNTLADMFNSLSKIRWAIEMKSNHRAESQLIVDNAARIADNGIKGCYKPLDFDIVLAVSGGGSAVSMPSPDKRFILLTLPPTDSSFELQDAIKLLLESAPGLEDDNCSQFIAFRRKDCELINELCCKHYSNHLTKNHKNKQVFQPRDKVCCTKNGNVLERTKEKELNMKIDEKSKESVRLCNGEIFFITEDEEKDKNRYLTLDDRDGRQVCVSFKELQKECRLTHAWARTIHTFQGSEAETVVYVLGPAGRQNWQHVYTAVTRGRKRVYVVAQKSNLIKTVESKCPRRNTRLRELIRERITRGRREGCGDLLSQGSSTQTASQQQPKPATGLGGWSYTQSTPEAHPRNHAGMAFSANPLFQRNLRGEKQGTDIETGDAALLDDVTFSQAYTWSPMDSLNVSSSPAEEEEPLQMSSPDSEVRAGGSDQGSTSVETVNCEGLASSSYSSGSKRQSCSTDQHKTPTKHPKVLLVESPLGCSKLQSLSLNNPHPATGPRQLFHSAPL